MLPPHRDINIFKTIQYSSLLYSSLNLSFYAPPQLYPSPAFTMAFYVPLLLQLLSSLSIKPFLLRPSSCGFLCPSSPAALIIAFYTLLSPSAFYVTLLLQLLQSLFLKPSSHPAFIMAFYNPSSFPSLIDKYQ